MYVQMKSMYRAGCRRLRNDIGALMDCHFGAYLPYRSSRCRLTPGALVVDRTPASHCRPFQFHVFQVCGSRSRVQVFRVDGVYGFRGGVFKTGTSTESRRQSHACMSSTGWSLAVHAQRVGESANA
jgi:hypothetical protein